ncbi:MAG: hypothetical protein AB7N65_23670 [Vicinamibacterales bacterium]
MPFTRRTFLAGAGLLGAGAVTGGLHVVRRRALTTWAADIGRWPAARDLGVEYLHRHASEADESVLLSHLGPLVQVFPPSTETWAAPDRLQARIRLEFRDAELVSLGGWRLARTELRLCALAAWQWGEASGAHGVFARVADVDGRPLAWTTPDARLRITPGERDWTLQLRSDAAMPQRVTLRVNGTTIDERDIVPHRWHRARYLTRPSDDPTFDLQVVTTPPWQPPGDFRTIGIGIDRV